MDQIWVGRFDHNITTIVCCVCLYVFRKYGMRASITAEILACMVLYCVPVLYQEKKSSDITPKSPKLALCFTPHKVMADGDVLMVNLCLL